MRYRRTSSVAAAGARRRVARPPRITAPRPRQKWPRQPRRRRRWWRRCGEDRAPGDAAGEGAARGPEHAVYSLVDNRLSAHLTRGGGLRRPGRLGRRSRSTRGSATMMKGGEEGVGPAPDRRRRSRSRGSPARPARVFVPLTAAQAATQHGADPRVLEATSGALSLKVNDNKDINGKLDDRLVDGRARGPGGPAARRARTRSRSSRSRAGTAVAWIQVGAHDAGRRRRRVQFYDPAQQEPDDPEGRRRCPGTSMVPDKAQADGRSRPTALHGQRARDRRGRRDRRGQAHRHRLRGRSRGARRQGRRASISTAAGCARARAVERGARRPGRRAAGQARRAAEVRRVRRDGLAARRSRARRSTPRRGPRPRTARSSPRARPLFVEQLRRRATSRRSRTRRCGSSNYLAKHKAIEMHDNLADKWMTIDEVAKKAGKFTAGASGNGYIRPARGFGTSWDKFVNHIEKSLGLKGADIMEKGLSLRRAEEGPAVVPLPRLHRHPRDVAREAAVDGQVRRRLQGPVRDRVRRRRPERLQRQGPDRDREKEHVRALYDSNVSYQDDLLGQLSRSSKTWGIYDQTMIIITADHGDEQWEDGRVGHGGSRARDADPRAAR